MQNYNRLINDILGQVYQDERLQRCLDETIKIQRDRILILHYVAMNIDRLSKAEIRERAYRYAATIGNDDLVARQIFLCLLHLADMS